MTKMIDTHAHLDLLLQKLELIPNDSILNLEKSNFSETQKIELTEEVKLQIESLLKNHKYIFQATVSTNNFRTVYHWFEHNPKIKFFLGSHPDMLADEDFNLNSYLKEQEKFLSEIKHKPEILERILGVGEIGLDYYWVKDEEKQKIQRNLFESQIDLAIRYNLPIQIHNRDAFKDAISILKNFPKIHGKFNFHCFTGTLQEMREIFDLGGRVGYGGIITFGKNAEELRETVNFCPLDGFILETDLPFLSPTPHRGKICLPEYIEFVGNKIAEIKTLSREDVWKLNERNTKELYPTLYSAQTSLDFFSK